MYYESFDYRSNDENNYVWDFDPFWHVEMRKNPVKVAEEEEAEMRFLRIETAPLRHHKKKRFKTQ